MADASYAIGNFTGGEISQFAQGRFDRPDYRFSMKTCLNAFPVEAGPWTRRPGTAYGGHTRGGAPARVIRFDFQASAPITLEFTDGYIRYRNGAALITSDAQTVVTVSTANPAVVQTAAATTWATGNTLVFPGQSMPLLENRQFIATKIDTMHFSLADALTGAAIDGSTLGALVAGATVARVSENISPYIGGAWAAIRAVQAETTDLLLSPTVAPQALTVTTLPSLGVSPAFAINPAVFNDGPYLDPFTNGVQATPSAESGIIALSLSFAAYDATKAYRAGDFVSTGGVNYRSLLDQNAGNAPAGGAPWWTTASVTEAINGGRGFLGSDIGRLVRLFSEPAAWAPGSTYAQYAVVSYNPSGLAGAATYWSSLVASNTGNIPGADLKNWTLITSAAIWSWGKITSLSNTIDRALAGSVAIGNMTSGGGLAAAFDGVFSQPAASSAERTGSGTSLSSYVGKNFSGASDQKIQQATIYPSNDGGFVVTAIGPGGAYPTVAITLNLRGKVSAPSSASDGTLLGTSGSISDTFSAVTIVSTDQTTAWKYVWVEMVTTLSFLTDISNAIAELSLFNPPGTGTGTGVNVEILGPPLLYTTTVATWRLGAFSDTTGYPSVGIYADGRIYLGGAIPNRFDACYANGNIDANGLPSGTINFAPTDQYGAVTAAHAISYTFNSDGVNQILWMAGDLQGVLMGTQASEWLVQAPTAGPISPLNIAARNVTRHGGEFIKPARTEHTLVFVKRGGRKLMEFFPDVFSGKFSAPNLADKAEHVVADGVSELAYTSAVSPIIWGRDALGALFGITYKRDSLASSQPPTFYGWHRHTLGSGRVVESLCSGPSTDGDLDTLTMVTNDTSTGIRHVEVLTDVQGELTTLTDGWYLDDAVAPTSIVSTASGGTYGYGSLTLNGLWHLNGKTVQVFIGGLDCGDPGEGKAFSDFVVASGSVTIPYGDSISAGPGRGLLTHAFVSTNPNIVVGFTYNSDGQLVRPIAQADTGARNGPAFGKLTRAHRYALKLVNTLGLSIGGSFAKLLPANFRQANNSPIPALTTFNGISQDTLSDDYSYDGGVCWRVSRPFPATVVVAGVNQTTQDQ